MIPVVLCLLCWHVSTAQGGLSQGFPSTCAATTCLPGYTCVDTGGFARCVPPTQKKGQCPLDIGPCTLEYPPRCNEPQCSNDGDCTGKQKCCSRCSCRVCRDPVTCANTRCPDGTRCELVVHPCLIPPCPVSPTCVPIQKPGQCPAMPRLCPLGGNPTCPDACQVDRDCRGSRKCCRRCGCKECVRALPERNNN